MMKKSVYSKSTTLTTPTILVTIILLLTKTTRYVLAQEVCKPAFQITGQKPPPGKCNTDDSDCCVVGMNYTAYRCSPAVTNRTEAVLSLDGFDKNEQGGGTGLARCDNRYHSDNSPVVALPTGWFNDTSRCGEVIIITGNGGRIAKAVVVDECNTYSGCDVNNDYQPPCPFNGITASKAVWAALGVSENSDSYGEINVTWAPTNEGVHLGKRKTNKIIIAVAVVVFGVFAIVWWLVVCIKKRRRNSSARSDEEQRETSLAILSEFPKRFSYRELKICTDNFNELRKLGSGGFGSVFEGTLDDRVKTRVAVKCLDYFKQGKKEFVTEVTTTGSVHHFNLVKLVGFCAEKGHRLLVYEYMSNGSLEKWIFRKYNKGYNEPLNWHTRKKIILHIVKGLCYLHEDCKRKIFHLDIKPQNILLDNDFNAKLGDFGLAKLIDKEDSYAVTQMRGTRGYLAPEWLSRKITEKVDVYSCGVVILEVVFQRKNLDHQNQDNLTLVEMVRERLEENQLFNVIEECCSDDEEMVNNVEEVEKMIKVAICCLQIDPTKRPSMSTVTKVLEGAIALEPIFNSTFANLECTTGNSNGILDDTSSILVPR